MTDSSGNRRDFLRGLLGRAARQAAARVPDSVADAASEMARQAAELAEADLASAFDVRADQRDIAEALVTRQALLVTREGLFVERASLSRSSLGAATRSWLERTQAGTPLDRALPRDAMLLETIRAELRETH